MKNTSNTFLIFNTSNSSCQKQFPELLERYLHNSTNKSSCTVELIDSNEIDLNNTKQESSSQLLIINTPKIAYHLCNLCGKCRRICNYKAISIDKFAQRALISIKLCVNCGQCIQICPKKAISFTSSTVKIIKTTTHKNAYHISVYLPNQHIPPYTLVNAIETIIPTSYTNIIYIIPPSNPELINIIAGRSQYIFIICQNEKEAIKFNTHNHKHGQIKIIITNKNDTCKTNKYYYLDENFNVQQLFV